MYTSSTALRRAWSQRLRRYKPKGGSAPRRRKVNPQDTSWFLQAARACASHRHKVPDTDAQMYVDRADRAFEGMPARLVSRHVKRCVCVFVETAAGPRALNGKLDLLRETVPRTRTAWMRQAVQRQIDVFRAAARRDGPRCHLCHKSLQGKMTHVDHGVGEYSFKDIARRFGETRTPAEMTTGGKAVRRQWQRFHKKNARLALACVACNLANK